MVVDLITFNVFARCRRMHSTSSDLIRQDFIITDSLVVIKHSFAPYAWMLFSYSQGFFVKK